MDIKKVGKGVVKGATKGVTKVGKGAVKGKSMEVASPQRVSCTE